MRHKIEGIAIADGPPNLLGSEGQDFIGRCNGMDGHGNDESGVEKSQAQKHVLCKLLGRVSGGEDSRAGGGHGDAQLLASILDLITEAGDDLGSELDVIAKLLTGEIASDTTALDVDHLSQIIFRLVDGAGITVGALPSAEHQCVGIGLALGVDGECREGRGGRQFFFLERCQCGSSLMEGRRCREAGNRTGRCEEGDCERGVDAGHHGWTTMYAWRNMRANGLTG
mmetsp:Transcript_18680/g.53717  ORF Transcript_18680/g.53717 Transcript_18680/m.53717 type:complete len:226 (-) Transcript_18680:70-747(-)